MNAGSLPDDLFADRHVGGDVVSAGQPLPDADDIGQLGPGLAERRFDVAPGLRGLLGNPAGRLPSARRPGVPDRMICSYPAGTRTASE